MTKRIQSAIIKFAAEHPEYGTKKGAYDNCRKASGEFCTLLHKRGMKEALVDEFSVVNGVAHKAVRIGDLWIDWTARQFNPKAEFPVIERDSVIRSMHAQQ